MRTKLFKAFLFIAVIAGIVAAAAIAATSSTTGTNTVCATATSPAHTVAVDGTNVKTIKGATASQCKTVTYTIPTVTQTVPATTTPTTTTPTTTTPTTTSSTTTTSTTTSGGGTGGTVPCALTHAAGADPDTSCWATHTGVLGATGITEAQIKADPAGSGFTVHTGDLTISQSNTVVDHEWIKGCITIADGANNVTVKDSLVTPSGSSCAADDAGGSAINTGQGAKIGTGTLIEDTTVDGGTPGFGSHAAGITVDGGEVLRVNLFGFGQGYLSDTNTAAHPAVFQDDYAHGYRGCAHDDGTWFDSSSFVTFNHGWVMTDDATQQGPDGCSTAALAGGADFGPQDHVVIENSYGEGVTGEATHAGCGSTDSAFIGNALSSNSKDFDSGFEAGNAGNSWSGNTVAETGASLPYNPGWGC